MSGSSGIGGGVLGHRPGHRTRTADLRSLLRDNPGSDPLMGNYTLVHLQDVVLNFQGLSERDEMVALTVGLSATGPVSQPYLLETGAVLQGEGVAGQHLAMVSADLRGDGREVIGALYAAAGELVVRIATNQTSPHEAVPTLRIVASAAVASVAGSCTVRVAAGRLLDGDRAALVVAWADDGSDMLRVQVWTTDAELTPIPSSAAIALPLVPGHAFDLAVGDVDGDGLDEVVLAYRGAPDDEGNTLYLTALGFADGPAPRVGPPAPVGMLGPASQIAVATGAFRSTPASDQVAIAWSDANDLATAVLYQADGHGGLTACGTPYVDTTYPLSGSMLVRVAVGDVDTDGFDELVLGAVVAPRCGYEESVVLHILAADDVLQLVPLSVGGVGQPDVAFAHLDLALAYGNLGESGSPAVVVAALGAAGLQPIEHISQLNVGLVQLGGDGTLPPSYVDGVGTLIGALSFEAQDPNFDLTLSMVLGDFSGQSIRVGPPTHFSFDRVNSILAIVNAPPTQSHVNNDKATLTFNAADASNTSFNYTVNDSWTASDELGVNLASIGQLTASMTSTYVQNFSHTTGSSQTYMQTMSNRLQMDDLIVVSGTAYDVWEYPVYDSADGPSPGCILVLFPDTAGPVTAMLAASTISTPYAPDHQPGVLLSYSSEPPADWLDGAPISKPVVMDVNDVGVTVMYSWTENDTSTRTQTQMTNISTSSGLNLSKTFNFFGGIGLGINGRFTNTYTQSSASNIAVTYTTNTSITIAYENLAHASQGYTVCPYIYFSGDGGFLVVDYVVSVPDVGYWQDLFSMPSAQFNQPWAADPDYADYTRSISVVPRADGSLAITARVANYSFSEVRGVQVRFYLGDPDQPGALLIGAPPPVESIAAQQRQDVSVDWLPALPEPGPRPPQPPYRLYATIEPLQSGMFAPSKGYTVWPPYLWIDDAAGDCPEPQLPRSTRVTNDAASARPRTPSLR